MRRAAQHEYVPHWFITSCLVLNVGTCSSLSWEAVPHQPRVAQFRPREPPAKPLVLTVQKGSRPGLRCAMGQCTTREASPPVLPASGQSERCALQSTPLE